MKKSAFRRDARSTALLFGFGGLALAIALALIAFFVWTLALRTEYRAFCLEVNSVILATPAGDRRIVQGELELPLSAADLDYYDKMLLDTGTAVLDRKRREPNAGSITLVLGENSLRITGVENTLIHLHWAGEGGERDYTVRSDLITYAQMNAYLKNMARRGSLGTDG